MIFLKLSTAEAGLRTLFAILCQAIYPIIAFTYNVFLEIAEFDLMKDINVAEIYKRVTILLTIIMVFYVTFQFVKYVVEPEKMTDKEKGVGNLTFKMLSVVLLLAFVPQIFNYANKLQMTLINNQIFSKVILGKEDVSGDKAGNNFSLSILKMFYYFDEDNFEKEEKCDNIICDGIVNMNYAAIQMEGKLPYLGLGLNQTRTITKDVYGIGDTVTEQKVEITPIHFDGIWATLVGGLIAWMLILYCVDVGARTIQLIYLQIIAPIPIIGFLSPKKEGIFQKWVKQCITTYLDIFIRLSLIYFIMLLSQTIINSDLLKDLSQTSLFVKIALVLGLMMFAKKAPKMLEELFPKMGTAGGNFGLKASDRGIDKLFGMASGTVIGAAAGLSTGFTHGLRKWKSLDGNAKLSEKIAAGASGSIWGAVRGTVGGSIRGLAGGAKKGNAFKNSITGAQQQIKSNRRFGNKQESGYTMLHQIEDSARNMFGVSRETELENSKAPLERKTKEHEAESKYRKSMGDKSFENAVSKGKGSENTRVSQAVTNYNKVAQREKDLEDSNSAVRKGFSVGQIKKDKTSIENYNKALTEKNQKMGQINIDNIKNNISEDSLGLDKTNYKKERIETIYDQAAHDAARENYKKDSGMSDQYGKPIKVFDKEAWEKDKDKFTQNRIIEEFDKEAYQAAVDKTKEAKAEVIKQEQMKTIEDEFNEKIKDFTYQTTEEADEALAEELAKTRAEKKKCKDEVAFAYEDWATSKDSSGNYNDAELVYMKEAREQENALYNTSAGGKTGVYAVNREEEIAEIMSKMGANASRSKAEDEYAKKVSNNRKAEADAKVREINSQIEKIKREKSGSTDK